MKRSLLKRRFVLAMVFLSVLLLNSVAGNVARAQQELLVSAAASLTNAFTEVGKQFETANPGVKVIFNFAASGSLLQQIDKGAPVDVFASADQKTMDQAKEKNLILTDTRKYFVSNGLVLIVPKDSTLAIKGVKDLAETKIARIALGNPESVPAGRYTQEVLTNAGLWEALKSKFIYAENVGYGLRKTRQLRLSKKDRRDVLSLLDTLEIRHLAESFPRTSRAAKGSAWLWRGPL